MLATLYGSALTRRLPAFSPLPWPCTQAGLQLGHPPCPALRAFHWKRAFLLAQLTCAVIGATGVRLGVARHLNPFALGFGSPQYPTAAREAPQRRNTLLAQQSCG